MRSKPIWFGLIAFLLTINVFGQTKNTINLIPHWKNRETHLINIKHLTTEKSKGQNVDFLSTFKARFTVKETSDSCYKVEWAYIDSKLAINDPSIEDQILAKLTNTKFLIKLSETGRFLQLLNASEVTIAVRKVLDELIAKSLDNPKMNGQYKMARELITSKQGLELVLKQIRFYHHSFGHTYKLNLVEERQIKLPNPFGGEPFNALEKFNLTKLDHKNKVCTIETTKSVDEKSIKATIINSLSKTGKPSPQIVNEINNANVEFEESTMQQIDLSRGIVQKSFSKRTLNGKGSHYRATLLEMETTN